MSDFQLFIYTALFCAKNKIFKVWKEGVLVGVYRMIGISKMKWTVR